ncbi:MAG: DUF6020 family protein [Butyrivibrio sp.]|nr:DUF6020 family protein [Butyrivibrio sp.]
MKKSLIAYMACFAAMLLLGMTVKNPLTVVIFGICFWLLGYAFFPVKRSVRIALLLADAAVSATIAIATYKEASKGFSSGLFKALTLVILYVGIACLLHILFGVIYGLCLNRHFARNDERKAKEKAFYFSLPENLSEKAVFFGGSVIIFICWLPYFLYEYPGIMTADSIVQYEQIIGASAYSNHHPAVHTLCISLFYHIGKIFTSDPNSAISFYTIAQMIFMALCCGRVVSVLHRIGKGALAALVFYAMVPFNAVFAVTIWKDVPFAGIVMLFCCLVYSVISEEKVRLPYVRFVILGTLLCLFRTNGFIAFILFIPFALLFMERARRELLCCGILVIGIVMLIKGPVMSGFNIVQADFTESLSVPLQQVARVLVNDRALTEKETEEINAVIDTTYIHELYAPDFADNMKELVRAGHPDVIENNKGEYLGLWFSLFIKYPGDYISAWYDLVGGYIYPDVSLRVGDIDGIMSNDYGLVFTPRIGGKIIVKGKEILIKLGSFLPLYGMLWSIGAYTWGAVFIVLLLLIKKKREQVLVVIMPLAIVVTLLIAAPVLDFRYGYALVMTMPLIVSSCFGIGDGSPAK